MQGQNKLKQFAVKQLHNKCPPRILASKISHKLAKYPGTLARTGRKSIARRKAQQHKFNQRFGRADTSSVGTESLQDSVPVITEQRKNFTDSHLLMGGKIEIYTLCVANACLKHKNLLFENSNFLTHISIFF